MKKLLSLYFALLILSASIILLFSTLIFGLGLFNVINEGEFTHLALNNSNLFFYMPLDIDDGSSMAHDYSLESNDGTVSGNAHFVANCTYGDCLNFDGNGDHVAVPSLNNDLRFADSFSISTWVRNDADIIGSLKDIAGTEGRANRNTDKGWFLSVNRNELVQFAVSDGTNAEVASGITDIGVGGWHHVVAVYDKSVPSLQVYVDGVPGVLQIATAPANGGQVAQDFHIGKAENDNRGWNGAIDEVVLFDKALIQQEVSDIFNSQIERFFDKGERFFDNLNVSQYGYVDSVNISIIEILNFSGVKFTVQVGDDDGAGGYVYGTEFDIINGRADNIPISTPDNIAVKIIFNSDADGFYTPLMIGNDVVDIVGDDPPIDPVIQMLDELINGGNLETIEVLYEGNSRVAKPTGFAFDGVEDIAFDAGRLAGNGFVVPLEGVGQNLEDTEYLFNEGEGMTELNTGWTVDDANTMLYAVKWAALNLTEGRVLQMANLGEVGLPLLPKDQDVILTVQYLEGPGLGEFTVTPVETQSGAVVNSHASTTFNSDAVSYALAWQDITLPSMINTSLGRSFTLEGTTGNSIVYRVGVTRNVAEGISVSEMGIGGFGYPKQADEAITLASAWTGYVAAFKPDIVIWQYAGNQGLGGVADATKELIDRVETVNPDAIHVLQIDNPSPRANSELVVSQSWTWASDVEGYEGAIIIDPTPYLPPEFAELQGTEQLGQYFGNHVHENKLGARAVANATWMAIEEYVLFNS